MIQPVSPENRFVRPGGQLWAYCRRLVHSRARALAHGRSLALWAALVAALAVGCSSASSSQSGVRARGNTSTANINASGQRTPLSAKQLVQRTKPAIVRIEVDAPGGSGFGTGFVLGPEGRIATNLHVISGATDIRVTLLDGTKLPIHEITAIDTDRDLAIISVRSRSNLPTLALGNSDQVAAGDPVIVIGNPLGVLDYSVSDGLISAVRRLNSSLTVLQISAPISQGSSGGPLFNAYGEVIGVATAIIGQGQNLNFGIPSNYLRPLLARNEGLSLASLAERLGQLQAAPSGGKRNPRVQRNIPQHKVSILDDCSQDSVRVAVEGIRSAIQNGAPLYNQGNHEACYRIYEGTAIRLERELPCQGLREALGQGLLRASTEEGYTLKAWAMRDTFDGVLLVAKRKYPGTF
ncbi:MAG: S1C family serine protease [Proteobacteria bacterium]|nr:S1C family serine protease [Pseudomonadota bacterium]